jgi:hypothetical protein
MFVSQIGWEFQTKLDSKRFKVKPNNTNAGCNSPSPNGNRAALFFIGENLPNFENEVILEVFNHQM